jgi:hypothetical protein
MQSYMATWLLPLSTLLSKEGWHDGSGDQPKVCMKRPPLLPQRKTYPDDQRIPTIKNTDKGRSTCAVVINPARQGQEHMCTGNHSCKKAFAQPATATHDSNSIGCNHCSLDCKTSLSATSAGASDAEHSYWNLGYKKTRSPSHTVAKVNHSLLAHDDKARTTSFAGSLQMLPSYILRGKHSLPQP